MTLLAMPPQALWSLMQLGQFLTGVIAGMDIGTLEQDFWFYAGLMAVFTAIFCAITLTYQVCCVAPFTPRVSCRRIDPQHLLCLQYNNRTGLESKATMAKADHVLLDDGATSSEAPTSEPTQGSVQACGKVATERDSLLTATTTSVGDRV